jgi:hypothetical protein
MAYQNNYNYTRGSSYYDSYGQEHYSANMVRDLSSGSATSGYSNQTGSTESYSPDDWVASPTFDGGRGNTYSRGGDTSQYVDYQTNSTSSQYYPYSPQGEYSPQRACYPQTIGYAEGYDNDSAM